MRPRRSLWLISAGVLAFWALVKIRLFRGCEYHHDLYSLLEQASGWLRGDPFGYDNRTGLVLAVHSYYSLALLGPVIRWGGGAYGFFAVQIGLTFWALARGLRNPKVATLPFLLLLLGPIAFWIFDDPFYGGHVELLYLPLAVLFSLSLEEKKSCEAWIWAAIIILLKEDGALLMAGLVLILPRDRRLRRWKTLLVGCGACFIVSMLAIQLVSATTPLPHTAGQARFGTAIARTFDFVLDPDRAELFIEMLYGALALLSGGLVLAWAVFPRREIPAVLQRFAIATLPSLGSMVVSSAFYPDGYHGLTWTTRFVMLWALWLAAVLIQQKETPRARTLALLTGASLALQIGALWIVRDYSIVSRMASAASGRDLTCSALSAGERGFLSCAADHLDLRTTVAPDIAFFAPFHRQELVWLEAPRDALHAPALVICDGAGRFNTSEQCLAQAAALSPGTRPIRFEGLRIWAGAATLAVVRGCM